MQDTVRINWPRGQGVLFAFPVGIWTLLFGFVAVMSLREPRSDALRVLGFGSLALGAVGAYFAAVHLLNATRVRCTEHELRVEYGPLPLRKAFEIPLEQLAGFEVVEKVRNHESGGTWSQFIVVATRKSGAALPIHPEFEGEPSARRWCRELDELVARSRSFTDARA